MIDWSFSISLTVKLLSLSRWITQDRDASLTLESRLSSLQIWVLNIRTIKAPNKPKKDLFNQIRHFFFFISHGQFLTLFWNQGCDLVPRSLAAKLEQISLSVYFLFIYFLISTKWQISSGETWLFSYFFSVYFRLLVEKHSVFRRKSFDKLKI